MSMMEVECLVLSWPDELQKKKIKNRLRVHAYTV